MVLVLGAGCALVACDAILETKDRYLATTDAIPERADATAVALDAALRDAAPAADAAQDGDGASTDAAADSGPIDPTLVAFWTFDEDGGLTAHDGTGHGNELTVGEGATIGGTGYFGTGALQFPPLNGQATSDTLSGDGFPPVGTLSMWCYFMTPSEDLSRSLFDFPDATRHHFYVRYTEGNASPNGPQSLDYATENPTGYDFFANPRPSVATAQWIHLVIVWQTPVDGGTAATAKFYVDENLQTETDQPYNFSSGPLDQDFILYNGYGGPYDDIYLWNRALSDIEVASLPTK